MRFEDFNHAYIAICLVFGNRAYESCLSNPPKLLPSGSHCVILHELGANNFGRTTHHY